MNSHHIMGYFTIFLFLGIGLTGLFQSKNPKKVKATQQIIDENVETITDFRSYFKRIPNDISELRAFALASNKKFSAYDAWNQRLTFEKITAETYMLKSLHEGIDLPMISRHNLESLPTKGLPDDNANDEAAYSRLYPPTYIAGLKSTAHDQLVARIYVDKAALIKRLVIRSLTNENLIYTAFHDRVDEFLWVKDQQIILFSTAKSEKYKQGLFIWNLKTGQTYDLLPKLKAKVSRLNQREFHLALSAVIQSNSRLNIYVFAHTNDRYGLNPNILFSRKNHFKISLENIENPKNTVIQKNVKLSQDVLKLPQEFEDDSNTNSPGGYPEQKAWRNLSTKGPVDDIIDQWQNYAISYSNSPMVYYSLMWICIFYAQAAEETTSYNSTEAHILKSLGIELADALEQQALAPSYIIAIASWVKHQLLRNQFIELKAAKFKYFFPLQLESKGDKE